MHRDNKLQPIKMLKNINQKIRIAIKNASGTPHASPLPSKAHSPLTEYLNRIKAITSTWQKQTEHEEKCYLNRVAENFSQ
jgi:hypothetical protein